MQEKDPSIESKDKSKESKAKKSKTPVFIRKLRRLSRDEVIIAIPREFNQEVGTQYIIKMEDGSIILTPLKT